MLEEDRHGYLESHRIGSIPSVHYFPDYLTKAEEERILHHIYNSPNTAWKPMRNRRLQNWGGVVQEKGMISQPLPDWLKKITTKIFKDVPIFPSEINHVLINEYKPGEGIMPHQDGPLYFPTVAIISLNSSAVMNFSPHPSLSPSPSPSPSLSASPQQEKPSDTKSKDQNHKNQNLKFDNFSVLLMPRSLLLFKDHAYKDYLHGIKETKEDEVDKNVVNFCMDDFDNDKKHPSFVYSNEMCESYHDMEESNHPSHQKIMYERRGDRISLTCRVVLKVKKNFLKL